MTAEELKKEVCKISQKIGVNPKDVKIEKLKNKYGFCSQDGIITLSDELLSDDFSKRKEVIIHELLHLIYSNHGGMFKIMEKIYIKKLQEDIWKKNNY